MPLAGGYPVAGGFFLSSFGLDPRHRFLSNFSRAFRFTGVCSMKTSPLQPASFKPEYFKLDLPIGVIGIVYRADPFMLVRILLPGNTRRLNIPQPPRASDAPAGREAGRVLDFFEAYRCKHPGKVPWDLLHLDEYTPLERLVWEKTAAVPIGKTVSYAEIARDMGRPRSARFVGNTLGKNPFPILIPCHRIVRADGGLGGFGSGLNMKRRLLSFEGVISAAVSCATNDGMVL